MNTGATGDLQLDHCLDADQITDRLIDEARGIEERIGALMLADERMLATGLTFLAAAASIAIANGKPQFLMALPFALAVLYCFISYEHSQVMALGGYKCVLEEAIRARVGGPLTAWETVIAPTLHRGVAVLSVRVLSLMFYFASVYGAIHQAVDVTKVGHWGHSHAVVYVVLTGGSVVIGAIAMLLSGLWAGRQYERVAELARRDLLLEWSEMGRRDQSSKGEHRNP